MNVFRRTYFIYPEIQKPLIKQIMLSLVVISFIQCLFIFLAMKWLEMKIQADITIIVDYRVLGTWRTLLYSAVLIPIVMNFFIGLGIMLFVSNRFAGPLFRLERELDRYLEDPEKNIQVHFRKDDYLHALAQKVNRVLKLNK